MVVGRTRSNISIAEIFNYFSETEILTSVFPEIKSLPCLINSPLRQDNHPSFGIFLHNNRVKFRDFATGDKGGLLDLLCAYWHCTIRQCLDKISSMLIKDKNITFKSKQVKTVTRKEHGSFTSIQVVVRPWHDYDYDYWASYGVEKKWLHYAEVYPISYKIITKKTDSADKGKKYIFPADKYAYAFVERKEGNLSLKVYQPYNKKGFKWCSKMDGSVISLWTKIPEYGDKVIICSSLKDALCVSCQLHIPALCPQGEGYEMSETAINELKRRYKKVYVSFDTDKAGIEDARKFAERTGFINIVPDLKGEKDFSDYYKSLQDKSEFQKLKQLFN